MASNRDWGVQSQTLTVPPFAGPAESAIIIGPDLPACMQTRYVSAVFYRPDSPIGLLLERYTAICNAVGPFGFVKVETGWAWRESGGCWFISDGYYWADAGPGPGLTIVESHGLNGISGGSGVPAYTHRTIFEGTDVELSSTPGFTYDSRHLARGYVGASATNSSVGLNTVYADLSLISNVVWGAGRAFRVNFRFDIAMSSTTNVVELQMMTGSGPTVIEALPTWGPMPVAGRRLAVWGSFLVRNSSGSDITADCIIQGRVNAGTANSQPTVVWVENMRESFSTSGAIPQVVA